MAIHTNIQAALDTKLATLASGTAIAWQNVSYEPVIGTNFIRTNNELGAALRLNIDDRLQRIDGAYILDVFVEAEKGVAASNTLIDEIYTLFAGVDTLSSGGTIVSIADVSRGGSTVINDWYMTQVIINYFVFD